MPEEKESRAFGWPKNTVKAVLAIALVGSVIAIAVMVLFVIKEGTAIKTTLSVVFTPIVLMADRAVRDYFQKGKEDNNEKT